MDGLRQYLLSVICAAMIGGIITHLARGNGTLRLVTKLLCSLFILYMAVKPLPMLDLTRITSVTSQYTAQANKAAALGAESSAKALRQSIKEQSQAYILDKAEALDADLQVEVELSDEEIPVPKTVAITGKISPYAREKLSAMIVDDLGIEMEYQRWN